MMSEQQNEHTSPPSPPPGGPQPEPTIEEATVGTQPQPQQTSADEETFPVRLVRRETGARHFVTASGTWETITHGETGEPESEYVLLATVGGVDVPLAAYNAGRLETIVQAQQRVQRSQQQV